MKTLDFKTNLDMILAQESEKFDCGLNMICEKTNSPGYHTTVESPIVHKTRESLMYASLLLLVGGQENIDRATKIINIVNSLQNKKTDSEWFGVWPWFYEEPLEKMSPPDMNWANFCGRELLQIVFSSEKSLNSAILEDIKEAIDCACCSIVKRNVSPKYSNIAVMGAFVTIAGGEYLSKMEYVDYGKNLLKQILFFVDTIGEFSEYNSPAYTMIILEELKRIINYVADEESIICAEKLYDKAWRCIAIHYHPKSGQWSGPHARCYQTLRNDNFYSFLYYTTKGVIDIVEPNKYCPSLDALRLNIQCPAHYIDYFKGLNSERKISDKFEINETKKITYRAYTYLTDKFSMGSVNKMDMWNQRRNLIVFYGNIVKPAYLHVRFLHDDYDFCSAIFTSQQIKGTVLAMINLSHDGGDRHNRLDTVSNGVISLESLKLSFEIGGHVESAVVENKGDMIIINHNSVTITVKMHMFSLRNAENRFRVRRNNEKIIAEMVICEGDRRELNLKTLKEAVYVFSVAVDEPSPEVCIKCENELLIAASDLSEGRLEIRNYIEGKSVCDLLKDK